MRSDTGFEARLDGERLGKQLEAVRRKMLFWQNKQWLTLAEISSNTGYPEASISARLRDLRRLGYVVDKRRRGVESRGLWEYRVSKPVLAQQRLAFSADTATEERA